ncbi:MAG: DNA adenine methylase [Acidobacteriia bacterium]|nr:DNA adenine methylase [Terriglobia bacterium]
MVGPLSYLGGKNHIARKIISLIPEHTCYIESFCGGAQVFFTGSGTTFSGSGSTSPKPDVPDIKPPIP